jgi:deoxycytidylate deaminase
MGRVKMRTPQYSNDDLRKFMALAKAVEDCENPCLSRSIGTVIIDPVYGKPVAAGHNGPPLGSPRCDEQTYLKNVVWPQLTSQEKATALGLGVEELGYSNDDAECRRFVSEYKNCGTCPRRLVNARSGQRLELCSCAHSEAMAVVTAGRSVAGTWLFAHCGVPCAECTKVIIEARVAKVYCINDDPAVPSKEGCKKDYSYSSRHMYSNSATELICHPEYWWCQVGLRRNEE